VPNDLLRTYWDMSQSYHQKYSGGKGAYLYTSDGRKILDAWSGAMNANIGHGNEAVSRHMAEHAQGMCALAAFADEFSESCSALATQLKDLLSPTVAGTTFCSSGSEAVETALALARTYWNRLGRPDKRLFLSLDGSYHGCTMGALAVTGRSDGATDVRNVLPQIRIRLPAWNAADPLAVSRYLKAILKSQHAPGDIAAIILEPVMGLAGMIPAPPADLTEVVNVCRECDILVIFDEVLTGLGRSGKLLAADHFGVPYDMLLLSKGLGCGFIPIGSVSVSAHVRQTLEARSAVLLHGHTASGNAFACGVASVVLREIQRLEAVKNAAALSPMLLSGLRDVAREHPFIRTVRGLGLCIGMVCENDQIAFGITKAAFDEGLRVRFIDDTVTILPPLTLSEKTALLVIDRLAKAIFTVRRLMCL